MKSFNWGLIRNLIFIYIGSFLLVSVVSKFFLKTISQGEIFDMFFSFSSISFVSFCIFALSSILKAGAKNEELPDTKKNRSFHVISTFGIGLFFVFIFFVILSYVALLGSANDSPKKTLDYLPEVVDPGVKSEIIFEGQLSKKVNLTENKNYFSVSRDGRYLLYFSDQGLEVQDLLNRDSFLIEKNYQYSEKCQSPQVLKNAWSPDNKKIVYIKNEDFLLKDLGSGSIKKVFGFKKGEELKELECESYLGKIGFNWIDDKEIIIQVESNGDAVVVVDIESGAKKIYQSKQLLENYPDNRYSKAIDWDVIAHPFFVPQELDSQELEEEFHLYGYEDCQKVLVNKKIYRCRKDLKNYKLPSGESYLLAGKKGGPFFFKLIKDDYQIVDEFIFKDLFHLVYVEDVKLSESEAVTGGINFKIRRFDL